MKIVCAKL